MHKDARAQTSGLFPGRFRLLVLVGGLASCHALGGRVHEIRIIQRNVAAIERTNGLDRCSCASARSRKTSDRDEPSHRIATARNTFPSQASDGLALLLPVDRSQEATSGSVLAWQVQSTVAGRHKRHTQSLQQRQRQRQPIDVNIMTSKSRARSAIVSSRAASAAAGSERGRPSRNARGQTGTSLARV